MEYDEEQNAETTMQKALSEEAKEEKRVVRFLPEIVEEAVERGAKVIVTKKGFEVDGFYKMGAMRLEPGLDPQVMWAIDKKEKKTVIKKFDDLVKLNFDWWKKSRDKTEFINPGREWLDEFVRLGLVQRQVIYVPSD